jgi:microcystin-dependent protein
MGGSDTVTLLASETPAHTHSLMAQTVDQGDNRIPSPARNLGNTQMYSNTPSGTPTLSPSAVTPAGGGLPHNNMQPYLTLTFCIAMQGVFPPRG